MLYWARKREKKGNPGVGLQYMNKTISSTGLARARWIKVRRNFIQRGGETPGCEEGTWAPGLQARAPPYFNGLFPDKL